MNNDNSHKALELLVMGFIAVLFLFIFLKLVVL